MARIDTFGHFLTDVATAIRNKTGKSETIACEDFDTEIENISGGGSGETVPIFSTTEVVVGTWIDDKPLYMKTVTQTITTSSTGSYDVRFNHGLSNIGIMFLGNNSFIALTSDMSQSYPINYSNTTSNTYSQILRTNISSNGTIRTLSGGSIFPNSSEIICVVNIFYTKKADSAVEDVNMIKGNHYSTTEHEVGKDMLGETVYEKTVTHNAYHGFNNPFNQTIPHNISDVKKIWLSDGTFLYSIANSNDIQYLPINYINAVSDKVRQFCRGKADNTNVQIYIGDYMLGNGTVYTYITLRYTKNTA